jgi:hypothetical protein
VKRLAALAARLHNARLDAIEWFTLKALPFAAELAGCPVCAGCSDVQRTEAQALAAHWTWGTSFDGEARWVCPACRAADVDPVPW